MLMLGDLGIAVIGFLVVALMFGIFFVRDLIEKNKTVDPKNDFALVCQDSFLPILSSILGVFVFFIGIINAAMTNWQWQGVAVSAIGLALIYYRFHVHQKFVFRTDTIACVRGGRGLGEFELSQITRFVRVDVDAESFLGLETSVDAPPFMPRPSAMNKALFEQWPEVSIVFSSQLGRVHADVLLRELQGRISREVPVEHASHSAGFAAMI